MTELEQASYEYRAAQAIADGKRERLHAAILNAVTAGTPQVDIVKITGYTRERIRQLARAAEIGGER